MKQTILKALQEVEIKVWPDVNSYLLAINNHINMLVIAKMKKVGCPPGADIRIRHLFKLVLNSSDVTHRIKCLVSINKGNGELVDNVIYKIGNDSNVSQIKSLMLDCKATIMHSQAEHIAFDDTYGVFTDKLKSVFRDMLPNFGVHFTTNLDKSGGPAIEIEIIPSQTQPDYFKV